jgi:hypothetical protein
MSFFHNVTFDTNSLDALQTVPARTCALLNGLTQTVEHWKIGGEGRGVEGGRSFGPYAGRESAPHRAFSAQDPACRTPRGISNTGSSSLCGCRWCISPSPSPPHPPPPPRPFCVCSPALSFSLPSSPTPPPGPTPFLPISIKGLSNEFRRRCVCWNGDWVHYIRQHKILLFRKQLRENRNFGFNVLKMSLAYNLILFFR